MEPYSTAIAKKFELKANDHWLRKRQGLALPALPPTTQEARQYYFNKIRDFTGSASANGKKHIDFEAFAQEWNRTADGKDRFYVTFEVLSAYAKGWEKTSNISATQEIMSKQIDNIKTSANVFAAGSGPFPSYIMSTPTQTHPSQGVVQVLEEPGSEVTIPSSLVTNQSTSRGIYHEPITNHPTSGDNNTQSSNRSNSHTLGNTHTSDHQDNALTGFSTTSSSDLELPYGLDMPPPLPAGTSLPMTQPSESSAISRNTSR